MKKNNNKKNKNKTINTITFKKKHYQYVVADENNEKKGVCLHHPMKKNTFWQSSRFGIRFNRKKKKYEMHGGVDFAAPTGTPIYSAEEGYITEITDKTTGYGKSIVIGHANNIKTRYAHLSKILVSHGQAVKANQIIGLVGATGNTRGSGSASHLHFEVIIENKKYNPIKHLRKPIL